MLIVWFEWSSAFTTVCIRMSHACDVNQSFFHCLSTGRISTVLIVYAKFMHVYLCVRNMH